MSRSLALLFDAYLPILLKNRGIYGTYHSSTGKNSVGAYSLRLDDSFVYPGTRDYGKFLGRAVRCFTSPST